MSYYKKFSLVLGNPLWPYYLHWAYSKCLKDIESLGLVPDLTKKGFTALLCGCGHEQTANTFIQFILNKNKEPKIIIIDLGDDQIKAFKNLVNEKYPNVNITVKQIDALELTKFISKQSIDWIETDALIEYFDHESLKKLLKVWKGILKPKGYITTRDCITDGFLTQIVDWIRVSLGKAWIGVSLFPHTKGELFKLFSDTGFNYLVGNTAIPSFKRISLVKREN